MPALGTNEPFGLNDLNVVNSGGTASADIPNASVCEVTPRFQTGELRGDDKLVAVASRLEALDWHIAAGGFDMDAAAIILGYSVSSTGSTPNQTDTFTVTGGACMPWFKLNGKALGEDCTSDLHIQIAKAKITSMGSLKLENGQFMFTDMSGIAIDDGTDVFEIIQHETAAALPTS